LVDWALKHTLYETYKSKSLICKHFDGGKWLNVKHSKDFPIGRWLFLLMVVVMSCPAIASATETMVGGAPSKPWWFWPIILFFFCLILGILAVMAGVGGGVLYVPLVSGFFPFHLDFVRGIGLMVALAGALAAGPGLLRRNLANLRLALPVALIASTFSIIGAMLGLYLSRLNPNLIQSLSGRYHCRYRLFAVVFEKHRETGGHQTGRHRAGIRTPRPLLG
jgi:hypothetical protein